MSGGFLTGLATLSFVTNRPNIPLDIDVSRRWDRSSTLGGADDLGVTLAQNIDLKALVLHGYQDLQANYLMSRYVLEQATRATAARKRLFFGTYMGGHMFYLRSGSRAEIAKDVRSFFETAP